jgi:hypothetical protein
MAHQPFRPFIDPAVQHAVQHLVQLVSDVALRAGQTPLALTIAAAAIRPQSGLVDVDTLICGEGEPELVAIMSRRLIQTAQSADWEAETLDLRQMN